MKTFVQEGDALEFVAPSGGATAGSGYLIGATFGVARTSAAAGSTFVMDLCGVYALPKAATITPGPGVLLYWDDTNKNVTTTSSGNTKIGVHSASVAAGASDATLPVRLNESF